MKLGRLSLATGCLLALCSGASASPYVSSETRIDPGLRYLDSFEPIYPVISQKEDTLGFFVTALDAGGLRLYTRDLRGGELRMGSQDIGTRLVYDVAWDESGFWVVEIYLRWSGPSDFRIAHYPGIDADVPDRSVTLGPPGESFWYYYNYPVLLRFGDEFWVAWLNERLRLTRLSKDLEILEEREWPSWERPFSLSSAGDRALLAWVRSGTETAYLLFDSDGQPLSDEPRVIPVSDPPFQVAAAPLGPGWIIAQARAPYGYIDLTFIDENGVLQSRTERIDGIVQEGMALASSPDGAILAWWQEDEVYAVSISTDGTPGVPERLGDGAVNCLFLEGGREMYAYWTGQHFVVTWCTYRCRETADPGVVSDGGSEVVWAQWLDPDGSPLYPEPVEVNRTYLPEIAWIRYAGADFQVLLRDQASAAYQLMEIDADSGDSRLVTEQVIVHDYERGNRAFIRRTAQPAGDAFLVVYDDYQTYGWDGYSNRVILDRLSRDGGYRNVFRKNVEHSIGVAADGNDQATWMALVAEERDGSRWFKVYYDFDDSGTEAMRTWSVPADHPDDPVMAAASDRALVVWSDVSPDSSGALDTRSLHFATADVADPSHSISGRRLFPDEETDASWRELVRSPGETLLLYTAPDSTGVVRLFAVPFDREGQPVGTAPRPVRQMPRLASIDAIWDGFRYFVIWADRALHVEGIRIGQGGIPLDQDPIPLFSMNEGVGPIERSIDLSSDGRGTIEIAYDGNRLRTLSDDELPILVSNLEAEWITEGIRLSWEVHLEALSSFQVFRETVGDATGPVWAETIPAASGQMEWIDRQARRDRLYRYSIVGVLSDGTTIRFGPVSTTRDRLASRLVLNVRPNPVPGDRVRFDFALPSGKDGSSRTGDVEIGIYDPAGRLLYEETHLAMESGASGSILWEPRKSDPPVPAGIYYVQLRWRGYRETRPVTLLSGGGDASR